MLNGFDWLRLSRSGAELLATLKCLETMPVLFDDQAKPGPPFSALTGPCQRCWLYPCLVDYSPNEPFCQTCATILAETRRLGDTSRQSIVIWGFVNRLPRQLRSGEGFYNDHVFGTYIHSERRFLLMMPKRVLKPWVQELVLYHGSDLTGLVQIVPTVGLDGTFSMGDILCRVIQRETDFAMDRLRVQFYASSYQVIRPRARDQEGILTFEISEFLSLLEMASVFRTILQPEEQQALQQLLTIEDAAEAQFYWGRFLGYLNKEAKDMLSAWKIRGWSKSRVKLLYELLEYVVFYPAH